MEQQRNGDDLALGEQGNLLLRRAPGATNCGCPTRIRANSLAAIVHVTENSYNFVVGNHNGCFFSFSNHKNTTFYDYRFFIWLGCEFLIPNSSIISLFLTLLSEISKLH